MQYAKIEFCRGRRGETWEKAGGLSRPFARGMGGLSALADRDGLPQGELADAEKKGLLLHPLGQGEGLSPRGGAHIQHLRARRNIRIVPYVTMLDVIRDDVRCYGIVAKDGKNGRLYRLFADYTVLASGGIGGIFENSTNFRVLTGDAIAVCLKRGIPVDHVNYVQIHPTTLYTKKKGRRFLISESVRGEGAVLLDKNFKRFTDELRPRDIVTAAIREQMRKDATDHVWLDMRPIPPEEVMRHFPDIVRHCLNEGYDVLREPIPVVPSQHYFMGGIRSGVNGATALPGLYAVGETCCNGVHGKNRLASNSLLESLLFAKRAAQDINARYCPADMSAATAAEAALDLSVYANSTKLLREYKEIIRAAIDSENAACAAREGETKA